MPVTTLAGGRKTIACLLLLPARAWLLGGMAGGLHGHTGGTMNRAVWWIEIVSYALIGLMGARLLWVKGRAFLREWGSMRAPKSVGAAATHAHHHHVHDDHHHPHD